VVGPTRISVSLSVIVCLYISLLYFLLLCFFVDTLYFLAQRHRTATKRSNFWHSDLRDNCESAYDYVVHLTRVSISVLQDAIKIALLR